MKTTSSIPRPRWVCRVARLGCTVFARGPFAAHAESCADCRRYFARVDDLESALRRDAVRTRTETPIGLESRILQALAAETAAPRRGAEPRARLPLLAVVGGALAALAVGVFVLRDGGAPKPGTNVIGGNNTGNNAESVESRIALDLLRVVSAQLRDEVVAPTQTLIVDNALKQELGSVYADARSALGFLALNFLPTPRPDASPATARARVGG